jgi:hypothetical protein
MTSMVPPERGREFSFEIGLVSVADANVFQANPTLAAGDVKVVKDGVLDGNIDTLPSAVTSCTQLITVTLSETEMDADVVTVLFHDASGAEWQDAAVSIYTTRRTLARTPAFAAPIALNTAEAGWWELPGRTCLAAYQPMGAEDYADSLINLADPGTYDADEGDAPDWDAEDGWTFDGVSEYLTTGITTTPNTTIAVRFSGAAGDFDYLVGGSKLAIFISDVADRLYLTYGSSGGYDSSAKGDTGIAVLTGGGLYYWNGEYVSTVGSADGNGSALTIGGAAAGDYIAASIQAVAIYAEALTADEVDDLYDAMSHIGEASTVVPSSPLPPVRGKGYEFDVALVSQADSTIFQDDPTLEAGDVKVIQDGVLLGNIANLPVAISSLTRLARVTLNADETDADRIAVLFHDAADAEWQDHLEMIYTSDQTLARIAARSIALE